MDVLTDDHEREEAVRKWWREYWKPIALGVFIALAGLVGFRQYQAHMLGVHQEKAYELYTLRLDLNQHGTAALNGALEFMQQNEDIFGALMATDAAQVQIQAGQYEEALKTLNFAKTHGGDLIAPAAAISEAKVQAQLTNFDEAQKILSSLKAEGYEAMILEAQGDIALLKGDRAAAQNYYRQALDLSVNQDQPLNPLLQMKHDDVIAQGQEGAYKLSSGSAFRVSQTN